VLDIYVGRCSKADLTVNMSIENSKNLNAAFAPESDYWQGKNKE
jgi:hypothetical protein